MPASRSRTAADDSFAAGVGRAPTAATSHSFAKILVSQGRQRDALYVLAHIIREHPKFIPAYNEMASVYVRSDRLDDAVAVLETGLEHAPSDAVLQNNLGMCYLLKGDHEQALKAYTHATESMPTNPTFRSNRAAALALSGRTSEAENEYRSVLGKTATRQNLTILQRARSSESDDSDADTNIIPAPIGNPTKTAVDAESPPKTATSPDASAKVVEETEIVYEADLGETSLTAELESSFTSDDDFPSDADVANEIGDIEDADLIADPQTSVPIGNSDNNADTAAEADRD